MDEVKYREEWHELADAPLIFNAVEFAVAAHRGQFRKGLKVPYVYHPMDVGRILMDFGAPAEVVAAGILHDTLEDTEATASEIEEKFGPKVARLVLAASEPEGIRTWEERKRHTIEHLKTVEEEALYVILADKYDNIRSIRLDMEKMGQTLWNSFSRPEANQRWYYESIADAFGARIKEEPLMSLLARYRREVGRVFAAEKGK